MSYETEKFGGNFPNAYLSTPISYETHQSKNSLLSHISGATLASTRLLSTDPQSGNEQTRPDGNAGHVHFRQTPDRFSAGT